MKKMLAVLIAAIFVLPVLAGMACAESALTDGSYSAEQQGFGGPVKVEVVIDGGKITDVAVTGDSETAGIGGAALEPLAEQVKEAQGAAIDGVSGATLTSGAVKAAMTEIMAQASGKGAAELKIADGTYEAQAWSFSMNYQMNVKTVIEGGKIASIEVGDNGDTAIILNTAIENLIPAMIENQSVKVDSITGATVSSGAIKAATEDCLVQAITAAGGDVAAVSAFYTVPAKSTATETINTKVLVIGMGGAGIMTGNRIVDTLYDAYEGDTTKIDVLMIDKAAKYGGTSVTTSSPMSINPKSFVEKNDGKEYVDAAALKAAWMEYTEGDAKEWAIDMMMESSGDAVDYLIDNGFVFGAPVQGLSDPYLICCNYGDGFMVDKSIVQAYFDKFMGNYTMKGGKYMLQTEATSLITDETGRVTGVNAVGADGTTYVINAQYVVSATGGFAGNGEMEDKYFSDEYYNLSGGGRWNVYGMTQNDGKMIQSAIDNGAATYCIGMPPVSHIGGAYKVMHEFPIIQQEYPDFFTGKPATISLNDIPMMLAVAPNSMAVNRQGVRFKDETTLTAYGNWAAGAYFYTIWSDEQMQSIRDNGLKFSNIGIFINQGGWPANTPIPELYDVLEKGMEMDIIFKADTIEELAEKIGVDAATLAKTVADYNSYCDTKENPPQGIEKNPVIFDLSGRPMEGEYNVYEKIEGNGPYYAVKGAPWIYSTTGALDVDEQFRVLKTDGQPLEGLYAVGTDCLGILFTEKKEYVTYGGADQGWAFTSGYLAGEKLAETILAE